MHYKTDMEQTTASPEIMSQPIGTESTDKYFRKKVYIYNVLFIEL